MAGLTLGCLWRLPVGQAAHAAPIAAVGWPRGADIGGAATVFKLTECDTSGGSYTDITGAVGSGSTGNTRLPQTGDAGKVIKFFVPLGGSRLRFIKPEITTGATTIVGINVDLYRANEAPSSVTERGIAAQIFV